MLAPGSGNSYEKIRFGCCTADCSGVERGAIETGKCADGLPGTPAKTTTNCPAGAHCRTCRDGANVKADDYITCDENYIHVPAIPGGEPDCTGWCRLNNCTAPASTKDCPAIAHCATCKVGASSASDCLTCGRGYHFQAGIPGGEADCTGYCVADGPPVPTPPPDWCGSEPGNFTLEEWKAKGQDVGTVMGPMPSHSEVVARARGLLRWAEQRE